MSVPPVLRDAFDPERLRADGHRLIDALADQLARWQAGEGRAVPWQHPVEARRAWAELDGGLGAGARGELVDDLVRVVRASAALSHPHMMGHQLAPPLPAAVLAEAAVAFLNNGMGTADIGPASTPIELAVIDWMCRRLGLPEGAGGVMTHGGSVGNMTALLAMRQARAGFDVWKEGAHAGPPLAVVVSEDTHYSIARALKIMGWGEGGALVAGVDARHRMTAAAARAALDRAGARRVIGIVASAGSTATGAFDPLGELADLAAERGLWLHVDAAQGGGVALSPSLRGKLRGIERADSVVWDAHKLLMMPALVTAVLFRREAHVYAAFAQEASYLFAGTRPEETWWDLAQRTLECTKRMMALEVWATLRAHGEEVFGAIVDRLHELARELAELVAAAPDFELALEPETCIVCYRHLPGPGVDVDAHNRALRRRVFEDGRFYIVGTQLPRGYFLRSALMNPLIERRDLAALLDHLRELCRG
ncbi:MAG TPA: pyridoxal-dependent decarboxylase [Kofleriaceae bacterium]|nr:pyridoxal-dependent decarboxylase [Kofleriaceae bacterium]